VTTPMAQPGDELRAAPQDDAGKRELLARLLAERNIESATSLSPEQRRLLMLKQMEPGMPAQLLAGYLLRGEVDGAALQQSLAELTRRHESLRSTFVEVSGRVLRMVHPATELNVTEVVRDESVDVDRFVRQESDRELVQPFDLATGPLARARLLHLGGDRHVLLLAMHELIADEWSADILVRELADTYHGLTAGKPLSDATGPSYKDYARWRQGHAEAADLGEQLSYWRERLADVPALQLPSDRARPATKTYRCDSVTDTLPAGLVGELETLAAARGTDLETVLLTGFQVLLSKYARQTDIAVGTRMSAHDWDGLVGPAANTVVVRTDLAGDPTFGVALGRTAEHVREGRAHGGILFGALVDELHVQRDVSRTPFFQVMFGYRDATWTLHEDTALSFAPYPLPAGATAVDLTLHAARTESGVSLRIDFNTDLYDASTMRRTLGHLAVLLAAGDQPLPALPLLTADEENLVLRTWNETGEEFPADHTIHRLVETQAAATPNAIAVSCGGARASYLELNERANQLAHHLRERGVGIESRVSICLDRSVEMVIAMLAVLKAGGAYVPLDPEYPAERLQYLLADSDSQILITQREFVDGLPETGTQRLLIDEDWPEVAGSPRHNPEPIATADHLAYLIYTSGSTGRPKGVMLTHRGAVNNLTWRQRHWPLTPEDRVLQNHSFSFDPSLWATFWPLLAGARMVVTLPGQKYDSKALVRTLKEEGITVYAAVPSLNAVLMEEPEIEECTDLRYIQSGAELLTGGLQQAIFGRLRGAELINFYGPTETTVDSTAWVCERTAHPEAAPIGRPVANLTAYLLDDTARPVPIGVPGHICIGGLGLARGYHGRPGLTADRFIPNPFAAEPGERLYRTGDLGRYRPDGTLEFLGRADNQVKVRGYRIELGEVESALAKHAEVRDVVVVAREDTPGDKRLIAYVVRTEGSDLQSVALQVFLSEFLPAYMVPSAIVLLDDLPKTPNGKVDRKALPAPGDLLVDQGDFVAPRTELETEVEALFAKALGVQRVGVTQDFFELGGSSLMLARLASQLVSHFQVTLPVHVLFKTPSVAGVAETIRGHQRDGLKATLSDQHMTMLDNDAVLPDDITAAGLPHANYLEPKAVLLTGATGYLGAFILAELLTRTSADVYCLVRAKDDQQALDRLRDVMRGYLVWDESLASRIRPLAGDLGRPRLGLSEQVWDDLAGRLDGIYHSGATVNFVYPYSALRKPNVGGTVELLRLACTERLKAFHHVSTADVVLASHMPRPLLEDETALETPSDDPGGYTSSKWVSEKIVNIARNCGIPVNIYRPGLILGHTTTGATQPNDYLIVCFRGFIRMGLVPEYPRILDAVPVDYVAASIVHISLQRTAIGDIYHLFNSAPVSIRRFCDWIRSYGYEFGIVPFEEARQRALEVEPGHPLYSMVPLIRDAEYEPQDSLDPERIHLVQPELECKNTLRALEGSDIACPPASEQQAHLVLRFLIDQGHLESPEQLRQLAVEPS
jgi:myxalamid-type nonribosomal peptide synthetase MxaA